VDISQRTQTQVGSNQANTQTQLGSNV